jgi:uncharacterized protein
MWIDELQGFITALVCGPEVVMPSEWMSMVWNGEAPEWQSVDELRDLLGGMMRLWNTVARTVNAREGYAPILMTAANELGEEETVVEGWCRGFLRGVDMRREAWLSVKDETYSLDLFKILALARSGETGEADDVVCNREMRESLIEDLPETVYRLRAYWREHETPVGSAGPKRPGAGEGPSSRKPERRAKPNRRKEPAKAAKPKKAERPKPRKSGDASKSRNSRAAGSARGARGSRAKTRRG